MNHSPEPWHAGGMDRPWILDSENRAVADFVGNCRKANATHVVSCVNALANVPDPAKELARLRGIESIQMLDSLELERLRANEKAVVEMANTLLYQAGEIARLQRCEQHLRNIMKLSILTRDTEKLVDEFEAAEITLGKQS